MNEWFNRIIEQTKNLWTKWTTVQKIILFAIVGGVLLALILLITLSAMPSMVPLITAPITNEADREKISIRLDQEGVVHTVSADGRVFVEDQKTARRMVALLAREDLIPKEASPWDVFQMDRWTVTDFERQVNLRQALSTQLEHFIKALPEVDSAKVILVMPERELFLDMQNPVSVSIILTPTPGTDITTNRKKIEGIITLVKRAVEGLQDENIAITDHRGFLLNDFIDLAAFDDLELARRQLREKTALEAQYQSRVFAELSKVFSERRVRVTGVSIDLNFHKRTEETREFFPITITPEDPTIPYPVRETIPNVIRSREQIDESFRGTGFNPEGPPGQEGQIPPAYKDLDSLVGEYLNKSSIENYEVNERNTIEQRNPWNIERITASVVIDGAWKWEYDENGEVVLNADGSIKRDYTPVSAEDLAKARTLVEGAIGFDRGRADHVTVTHLQFDRSDEHHREDQKFRSQARVRQTVLYSLLGLAAVVIAFVAFRFASRELERRRRLREEELSRQHQAMREAALRSAEEDGLDVEMSVEERARIEMQENAINMAREHPEDVAQLIRTWLVEE